jgi:hypothetical protein
VCLALQREAVDGVEALVHDLRGDDGALRKKVLDLIDTALELCFLTVDVAAPLEEDVDLRAAATGHALDEGHARYFLHGTLQRLRHRDHHAVHGLLSGIGDERDTRKFHLGEQSLRRIEITVDA